jgi:hypothetical protein
MDFWRELCPQFAHHPLNVLWRVLPAIGRLVQKLTEADDAGMRIAGLGNEGSLGRRVNDALRRDVELIAGAKVLAMALNTCL